MIQHLACGVVLLLVGCGQPRALASVSAGTIPYCLLRCSVVVSVITDNRADTFTPTTGANVTGGSTSRTTTGGADTFTPTGGARTGTATITGPFVTRSPPRGTTLGN